MIPSFSYSIVSGYYIDYVFEFGRLDLSASG